MALRVERRGRHSTELDVLLSCSCTTRAASLVGVAGRRGRRCSIDPVEAFSGSRHVLLFLERIRLSNKQDIIRRWLESTLLV